MASPFPGMDPYLESHWGDVHASMIVYARDQIQGLLPPDLRARIEERVLFQTGSEEDDWAFPDVRVIKRQPGQESPRAKQKHLAVVEPLVVHLGDPITETFIEVRDAKSRMRVITVIEILSLSNKLAGARQEKYLKKRRELRNGRVSLVEIDLLRRGKRLFPFPSEYLPPQYRTSYNIWARRGWNPDDVEVYAVPMRQRLPVIKVPLRETDHDVPLDLQPLIEQVYQNGGYEDIDYERDPVPPLDPDHAGWADALLREKGFRKSKTRRRGSRGNRNGKRRKAD